MWVWSRGEASRTVRLCGVFVLLSIPIGIAGSPPQDPAEPVDVGILIGDSIVHGFGHSPVLYNDRGTDFLESSYHFYPDKDGPVESMAGFLGVKLWLNRGVTGNPSTSVRARWNRDVVEKLDRGYQKSNFRVRCLLISVGLTDLAAAVGTERLQDAEFTLRENLLSFVRDAKKEGIRVAFLELPDPERPPMGETFRTLDGRTIESLCESHKFDEEGCLEFSTAVKRTRRYMEGRLRRSGAEILDYAKILSPDSFLDATHPTPEGYEELGKILREKFTRAERTR